MRRDFFNSRLWVGAFCFAAIGATGCSGAADNGLNGGKATTDEQTIENEAAAARTTPPNTQARTPTPACECVPVDSNRSRGVTYAGDYGCPDGTVLYCPPSGSGCANPPPPPPPNCTPPVCECVAEPSQSGTTAKYGSGGGDECPPGTTLVCSSSCTEPVRPTPPPPPNCDCPYPPPPPTCECVSYGSNRAAAGANYGSGSGSGDSCPDGTILVCSQPVCACDPNGNGYAPPSAWTQTGGSNAQTK